MPVDPFFTSSCTKHYVDRPDVGDYLKKMFALPIPEQRAAIREMDTRKTNGEKLNWLEVTFMKSYRFRNAVKARAKRHYHAMRTWKPSRVYRGYNTTTR